MNQYVNSSINKLGAGIELEKFINQNDISNNLFASTEKNIFFSNKINPKSTIPKKKFLYKQECDVIILRNGEEIQAKVLEISQDIIKYKKCDFIEGPLYTLNKNKVFMIKYSNGQKDVFKDESFEIKTGYTNTRVSPQEYTQRKVNGMALAGFILSLLGISLLGIIFSAVGLNQISKQPERWSGQGFGIVGLLLGILVLFLLLVLLFG